MHSIMWFHELPEKKDVAKLFEEVLPLQSYSRLHSVLNLHRGEIEFKEVPLSEFDVQQRFKDHSAKDEAELVQIVENMLQVNMDPAQPLWEIHFIKNTGNGRSALVPKVHHAVGDGLSMVGLFLNFFTNEDGSRTQLAAMKEPKAGGKRNLMEMLGKFLTAFGKVLTLPASRYDTNTKLKDPTGPKVFSGVRKLVVAKPIDLQMVKDIKNATKTTINDVCVAALTGAIRRYCEECKDSSIDLPDLQVRSLLPYGFPRIVDPKRVSNALRNWWVLVSLELPLKFKASQVKERLLETKKKCDQLKASPEALVQYYVQVFANKVLPFDLQRQTNLDTILRHTCVFTNVPGPDAPVYFAGKKVDYLDVAVLNCVPQISAVSYNGNISVTWCLDDKVTPNAEKLAEYFQQELNELKKLSQLEMKE